MVCYRSDIEMCRLTPLGRLAIAPSYQPAIAMLSCDKFDISPHVMCRSSSQSVGKDGLINL